MYELRLYWGKTQNQNMDVMIACCLTEILTYLATDFQKSIDKNLHWKVWNDNKVILSGKFN